MNKKKENVTLEKLAQSIEDLAQMTAAGFLDHGNRISSLENRFDTLEEKMDTFINGQSRMLDILLNHTASRAEVRELDHRVVRLEQHLKMA